jgi:hypothetical protein
VALLCAAAILAGCSDQSEPRSSDRLQADQDAAPPADESPSGTEPDGVEQPTSSFPSEPMPISDPPPGEAPAPGREGPDTPIPSEDVPPDSPVDSDSPPDLIPPVQPPAEVAGPDAPSLSPAPDPGTTVPGPEVDPDPPITPDPALEPDPEIRPEPGAEKPADLGPPLVDQPETLIRLDPVMPLWLDMTNKQVVMVGQVCLTEGLLEVFACLKGTKEHEAVVTVDIEAAKAHAALLRVGADAGSPVRWDPYVPAKGSEIGVSVVWKDKDGKRQSARAQEWIYDTEKEKAMEYSWVFAGSGFWVDEETGQTRYRAEGGELICVSNFASAMLDLPIESSQANASLMFKAYTERIPPLGTPVTLLLKPKPDSSRPSSTDR